MCDDTRTRSHSGSTPDQITNRLKKRYGIALLISTYGRITGVVIPRINKAAEGNREYAMRNLRCETKRRKAYPNPGRVSARDFLRER